MTHHIRRAHIADNTILKTLDFSTETESSRFDAKDKWLKHDEVFLVETENTVTGYAVLRRSGFFDRDNLEMLIIRPSHRGQGLGELLLRHIEPLVQTAQFFITTNLSNHPMQLLLKRLNYISCGFIDQLDPGDPEIVFVKKILKNDPST
jgi:ribosomal protein S18 acetylase RimI-like enzyme